MPDHLGFVERAPARGTTAATTVSPQRASGNAEHRGLGDGRVLQQAALDLGRVDVLAAAT